MKVAVIGSSGQLGTDVCAVFEREGAVVERLDHDRIEVGDSESVEAVLRNVQPDLVVNAAAAHNVEACEADPHAAFTVNAIGARNVVRTTEAMGAYLIHISTDYVFDGRKKTPYVETDRAHPLNVYGNSKLAGEHFVLAETKRGLVMRVSGLYGRNPCRAKGRNFVELMLHLGAERDEVRVVDNEFIAPTSTVEVARQVRHLSHHPVYGLCHAAAEGSCSWYEFAATIFRIAGVRVRLSVADPGEFPMKTPRPLYSVLENRVLKEQGASVFRSWQDGLAEYLEGS